MKHNRMKPAWGYDAVIDECLNYNIEPVITISHYEMPLHLRKNTAGGKIAN